MKAKIVTKRFILCPTCGEDHQIEHLFNHRSDFGPWYCDDPTCTTQMSGTVASDGTVEITVTPAKQRPALHLLHGHGIWLIVEGFLGEDACDPDYYYREHTCTSNVLNAVAAVYLDDGEGDPHGIFEPIAHVPVTGKLRDPNFVSNLDFDEAMKLFGISDQTLN